MTKLRIKATIKKVKPQRLRRILSATVKSQAVNTDAIFPTADPTTVIYGLCVRRWGIFALVRDPLTIPLTQISR